MDINCVVNGPQRKLHKINFPYRYPLVLNQIRAKYQTPSQYPEAELKMLIYLYNKNGDKGKPYKPIVNKPIMGPKCSIIRLSMSRGIYVDVW